MAKSCSDIPSDQLWEHYVEVKVQLFPLSDVQMSCIQRPKKAQTDVLSEKQENSKTLCAQRRLLVSSSDYEAFKEAAEQFQPYIKFFATFVKSVSNHRTNT